MNAIHVFKAFDGWWIKVYTPSVIHGFLSSGPWKTKPTKAKLRSLQNRYFDGRKVNVTIEQ